MQVQKMYFNGVLPDNEQKYYQYLEGLVDSIDPDAYMIIVKKDNGISVRILPSEYYYFEMILKMIKNYHRMLMIEVDFSKSMKAANNISFIITF